MEEKQYITNLKRLKEAIKEIKSGDLHPIFKCTIVADLDIIIDLAIEDK